jgi:hypothetical protein
MREESRGYEKGTVKTYGPLHNAYTLLVLLLGLAFLILASALGLSNPFRSDIFFELFFLCLSFIFIALGIVSLYTKVGFYMSDPKTKVWDRPNFRTSASLSICIAVYLVIKMLFFLFISTTLEIALSIIITVLLVVQFVQQISTFRLLRKRHARTKIVPSALLISIVVLALISLFPILFAMYALLYSLTSFSIGI